ncbi:hypothetical protein HUB98_06140 [Paenibacillus barcinonensis]|uniref:ClpX C4-type zinc finger protein n=1 Tax=Paenibacillus barcinonensis TaxID=198119 RepID=A0A2V4W8E7_PAEBA|nr:ClpX C4-type zinc finger protein [Paenibacillus barcinonensis]QKS55960.1 hypothetical protein HUB98_06140 [Paenibacillus barcinonensis]
MNIDEKTIYTIVDKAQKYDQLLKLQGKPVLHCSFCGKSQNEVFKLVTGSNVYICDECVDICNEILEEGDDNDGATEGATRDES